MVLDSDFAKRKLPEFDGYPWGASIVHEESSDIISVPTVTSILNPYAIKHLVPDTTLLCRKWETIIKKFFSIVID